MSQDQGNSQNMANDVQNIEQGSYPHNPEVVTEGNCVQRMNPRTRNIIALVENLIKLNCFMQ